MKFLTSKVQQEPGFRFNLIDLLFIVLLVSFSLSLYSFFDSFYSFYLLPLYIGLTFFLFCNVFRVGTRLELIWISIFLLVSLVSHTFLGERWFGLSALLSSLVQAAEIIITIRSADYRGILSRRADTD